MPLDVIEREPFDVEKRVQRAQLVKGRYAPATNRCWTMTSSSGSAPAAVGKGSTRANLQVGTAAVGSSAWLIDDPSTEKRFQDVDDNG